MPDFDITDALERARVSPDSRRARLLRVAERLFVERGFDGVSVRDVAREAQVSVATLHLHWRTKATLYEGVCRLHAAHLMDFVAGWRRDPTLDGLSGAEKLQRLIGEVVDLLADQPAIARLALQSVSGQAESHLPALLLHDLSFFEGLADEVSKLMDEEARQQVEPALIVLTLFYFLTAVFNDATLQQAILGGSVYGDQEVRNRIKSFGVVLAPRLLRAAPREGLGESDL